MNCEKSSELLAIPSHRLPSSLPKLNVRGLFSKPFRAKQGFGHYTIGSLVSPWSVYSSRFTSTSAQAPVFRFLTSFASRAVSGRARKVSLTKAVSVCFKASAREDVKVMVAWSLILDSCFFVIVPFKKKLRELEKDRLRRTVANKKKLKKLKWIRPQLNYLELRKINPRKRPHPPLIQRSGCVNGRQ